MTQMLNSGMPVNYRKYLIMPIGGFFLNRCYTASKSAYHMPTN